MAKKLFDFCVGNPPYNSEMGQGENRTYAPPVYHQFIDASFSVADNVELIHPARFLFNAGNTPKEWNEKMLNNEHFRILRYEADANKVFPNTYINGGVCISYQSTEKNYGKIGVFTPFQELNTIIHKLQPFVNSSNLGDIIHNQTRYNLDSMYKDYPEIKKSIGSNGRDRRIRNNAFEKIPLFHKDNSHNNDVPIFGVVKGKREWRYLNSKYIDDDHCNLHYWKTLISSADGAAGTIGNPVPARVLGEPVVLPPNTGYTQTFIGVGSVETQYEAIAIQKYLKTKLCRTAAGILKITQHITPDIFRYVPIQDFSTSSDIDWSKSVHEIDLQLYRKYGLSNEEIDFIETYVKEMI